MEGLQIGYLLNDFGRQRSGLHRIRKRAADLWPVTRRRLLRLLAAEPLDEDLLLRGSEIELARRRGRARRVRLRDGEADAGEDRNRERAGAKLLSHGSLP